MSHPARSASGPRPRGTSRRRSSSPFRMRLCCAARARRTETIAHGIESFLQCPFQFFAGKTLRLKERPPASARSLGYAAARAAFCTGRWRSGSRRRCWARRFWIGYLKMNARRGASRPPIAPKRCAWSCCGISKVSERIWKWSTGLAHRRSRRISVPFDRPSRFAAASTGWRSARESRPW